MTADTRLTFQKWFQTVSLAGLAAIAFWVGSQLRDLGGSIQRLSEQMAVASADARRDREDVRDLKDRVRVLEARR